MQVDSSLGQALFERPPFSPPATLRDRVRDGDRAKQCRFRARQPLPLPRQQVMDDVYDGLPAVSPPYLPLHEQEA